MGPVSQNFILSNVVRDNTGYGITVRARANVISYVEAGLVHTRMHWQAGGYGHNPTKLSLNNIFASNHASGNGKGSFYVMHGAAMVFSRSVVSFPHLLAHYLHALSLQGDYWTSNIGPSWVRFMLVAARASVCVSASL